MSATEDLGRDACVLMWIWAYINSRACMSVCVHAHTFRCVHARARCACVLLACARVRVCGVLLVFSTSARNRSYFESDIARGQLYHCFSTLNVHQIDSPNGIEMLYQFCLASQCLKLTSMNTAYLKKELNQGARKCAYLHVCVCAVCDCTVRAWDCP